MVEDVENLKSIIVWPEKDEIFVEIVDSGKVITPKGPPEVDGLEWGTFVHPNLFEQLASDV